MATTLESKIENHDRNKESIMKARMMIRNNRPIKTQYGKFRVRDQIQEQNEEDAPAIEDMSNTNESWNRLVDQNSQSK